MQLEEFRIEKEMSYDDLADFLEIKKSTAYNICKGIGCIKLSTAHRVLAKTHGKVGYDDLLTNQEEC